MLPVSIQTTFNLVRRLEDGVPVAFERVPVDRGDLGDHLRLLLVGELPDCMAGVLVLDAVHFGRTIRLNPVRLQCWFRVSVMPRVNGASRATG